LGPLRIVLAGGGYPLGLKAQLFGSLRLNAIDAFVLEYQALLPNPSASVRISEPQLMTYALWVFGRFCCGDIGKSYTSDIHYVK